MNPAARVLGSKPSEKMIPLGFAASPFMKGDKIHHRDTENTENAKPPLRRIQADAIG